ncbi:hypothetical protein GGE09_004508 [Roseobacter sp. N2S]|nr:hypothetical protein [Roseobacter sp. N2S]
MFASFVTQYDWPSRNLPQVLLTARLRASDLMGQQVNGMERHMRTLIIVSHAELHAGIVKYLTNLGVKLWRFGPRRLAARCR